MPPGFTLVGLGDFLEDSADIGVVEVQTLRPGAVFCSEIALLVAPFAPPGNATRVMNANIESPADFRRCYLFHRFAHCFAGPYAIFALGSPGQKLKVQVPEPETKWVWEDEQLRILEEIRTPIYKACIRFLMLQGCRPGEARALRWENVDFDKEIPIPDGQIIKGVITIRAAMDQEVYEERTKERDVRVLPMHP